jgi:hypothetical protein
VSAKTYNNSLGSIILINLFPLQCCVCSGFGMRNDFIFLGSMPTYF